MRQVRTLLAALGTPRFAAAFAALGEHGAVGAQALCRALAREPALGPKTANGRAVMEDLEQCLVDLGRAEPAALLEAASSKPLLLSQFAFVSALTRVDRAQAADHLVAVLGAKSGALRWLALEALIARRDPRGLAHLARATRDRDGLVVFAAVTALRRFGAANDVPRLVEIAEAGRTPPGTREAAYDAIEAICARAKLALPPGAPAPRLVEVPLPAAAKLRVTRAELVAEGAALTEAGSKATVRAPCSGVVIDVVLDTKPHVLVLRRQDAG